MLDSPDPVWPLPCGQSVTLCTYTGPTPTWCDVQHFASGAQPASVDAQVAMPVARPTTFLRNTLNAQPLSAAALCPSGSRVEPALAEWRPTAKAHDKACGMHATGMLHRGHTMALVIRNHTTPLVPGLTASFHHLSR
jgi:hypothetical protein